MKKIYDPKAARKKIHLSKMKTIRFSELEIKEIEKQCKIYGEKFSTYARKKILNINMKTEIELTKILEVNRIGNNLNQVAKKINQNKPSNLIEILQALKNIEDKINKL